MKRPLLMSSSSSAALCWRPCYTASLGSSFILDPVERLVSVMDDHNVMLVSVTGAEISGGPWIDECADIEACRLEAFGNGSGLL
jgi:hypothetical protein